jgi:ABC-type sulfate/molybdate transport systems ATPase subunit
MDIRLDGVRFRRAGRDVLAVRSLHVRTGRTTAVLGPNGAGKTTLLRLVAGLEVPHEGRVLVGGEPAATGRGVVGYVFQEEVFLRRTILENVEIGLRIRGASRSAARGRAMDALVLLGIEALAGRRADRLSGGETRRASLARALCLGAPVLLLDEPMAGLDGSTYARLLDDLPGLLRAAGATTVVVTHDREEAFRLCDDVVVLVDGEVRAVGSKEEVASNPRRRDVAETLGYTILPVAGRVVAVPEGGLSLADRATGLEARVEGVLDLVHEWDVTAIVADVRVHIRLPRACAPPRPGASVALEARRRYDLS